MYIKHVVSLHLESQIPAMEEFGEICSNFYNKTIEWKSRPKGVFRIIDVTTENIATITRTFTSYLNAREELIYCKIYVQLLESYKTLFYDHANVPIRSRDISTSAIDRWTKLKNTTLHIVVSRYDLQCDVVDDFLKNTPFDDLDLHKSFDPDYKPLSLTKISKYVDCVIDNTSTSVLYRSAVDKLLELLRMHSVDPWDYLKSETDRLVVEDITTTVQTPDGSASDPNTTTKSMIQNCFVNRIYKEVLILVKRLFFGEIRTTTTNCPKCCDYKKFFALSCYRDLIPLAESIEMKYPELFSAGNWKINVNVRSSRLNYLNHIALILLWNEIRVKVIFGPDDDREFNELDDLKKSSFDVKLDYNLNMKTLKHTVESLAKDELDLFLKTPEGFQSATFAKFETRFAWHRFACESNSRIAYVEVFFDKIYNDCDEYDNYNVHDYDYGRDANPKCTKIHFPFVVVFRINLCRICKISRFFVNRDVTEVKSAIVEHPTSSLGYYVTTNVCGSVICTTLDLKNEKTVNVCSTETSFGKSQIFTRHNGLNLFPKWVESPLGARTTVRFLAPHLILIFFDDYYDRKSKIYRTRLDSADPNKESTLEVGYFSGLDFTLLIQNTEEHKFIGCFRFSTYLFKLLQHLKSINPSSKACLHLTSLCHSVVYSWKFTNLDAIGEKIIISSEFSCGDQPIVFVLSNYNHRRPSTDSSAAASGTSRSLNTLELTDDNFVNFLRNDDPLFNVHPFKLELLLGCNPNLPFWQFPLDDKKWNQMKSTKISASVISNRSRHGIALDLDLQDDIVEFAVITMLNLSISSNYLSMLVDLLKFSDRHYPELHAFVRSNDKCKLFRRLVNMYTLTPRDEVERIVSSEIIPMITRFLGCLDYIHWRHVDANVAIDSTDRREWFVPHLKSSITVDLLINAAKIKSKLTNFFLTHTSTSNVEIRQIEICDFVDHAIDAGIEESIENTLKYKFDRTSYFTPQTDEDDASIRVVLDDVDCDEVYSVKFLEHPMVCIYSLCCDRLGMTQMSKCEYLSLGGPINRYILSPHSTDQKLDKVTKFWTTCDDVDNTNVSRHMDKFDIWSMLNSNDKLVEFGTDAVFDIHTDLEIAKLKSKLIFTDRRQLSECELTIKSYKKTTKLQIAHSNYRSPYDQFVDMCRDGSDRIVIPLPHCILFTCPNSSILIEAFVVINRHDSLLDRLDNWSYSNKKQKNTQMLDNLDRLLSNYNNGCHPPLHESQPDVDFNLNPHGSCLDLHNV